MTKHLRPTGALPPAARARLQAAQAAAAAGEATSLSDAVALLAALGAGLAFTPPAPAGDAARAAWLLEVDPVPAQFRELEDSRSISREEREDPAAGETAVEEPRKEQDQEPEAEGAASAAAAKLSKSDPSAVNPDGASTQDGGPKLVMAGEDLDDLM